MVENGQVFNAFLVYILFILYLGEVKGKMSKNVRENPYNPSRVWVGLKVIRM